MDHKSRVLRAVRFEKTDRPPFDMFDECGSLFTDGLYDPALRMGLSMSEQIEARVRFHRELDTDLIFDAPVIGASLSPPHARIGPRDAERCEVGNAYFPFASCLWMPWSPHVVAKPGHTLTEVDNIEYIISWENGLEQPLYVETASGNPSGYDNLMKSRDEWPLWKEVFSPDLDRFDYSYLAQILAATGGDVALYGTTACPFSLMALLLGIENAITVFLDDPDFARELMDFFTETVIEVAKDCARHGIDLFRVGGAWTSVLGPAMFEQFVLPYHLRLSAALRQMGCPSLLHCCGHVNAMLESYTKAGWDGLEPLTPPPLGNVKLSDAKRRVGDRVGLKGNIDPVHVLKAGSADIVAGSVRDCLAAGGDRGFIFSVADCMAPGTRREHMEIVSDIVHRNGE